MIINAFRRWVRGIDRRAWLAMLGIGVLLLIMVSLPAQPGSVTPEQLQPTIDAAATQQNIAYPTLRTALTLTPVEAMITQMAPTLALEGYTEVQQYAASASADNSRSDLDWGAIQAAGPPNTETCGDHRTAWATIAPNSQGILTLYYPQLVIPTRIVIHQSFNPGFVQHVNIRDVYGDQHTVYTTVPFPSTTCPETLVIDIPDADFAGNTVIVYLDQRGSTGGWTEIDAVQLIGTKYN
jgi:hypothetical protein